MKKKNIITLLFIFLMTTMLWGCGKSDSKTPLGYWEANDGVISMEFFEDGTAIGISKVYSGEEVIGENEYSYTWSQEDGTNTVIIASAGEEYPFELTEEDGKEVLKSDTVTYYRVENATDNDSDSSESSVKNWSIKTEVDEFGDEVANGKKYIQTAFSGDFSNTATNSSELKGYLSMIPTEESLFAVSFKLLEYGDNPVTYYDSDVENGITLKTKINGVVNEYYLVGNSPNGDLFLSDDDYYFYHDLVDNSGEMKCIITIGSSQYNFTIQTGNIKEVCEDAFGILADGIQTMNQALTAFLNRNMHGERYNYIVNHMEEYPAVNNDELNNMFDDGYWMEVEVDNVVFDQWWVFEFKDGKRYQVFRIYDGEYESFENNSFEQNVQIANNKVYIGNIDINEKADEGSEYRKIADGYYIEKTVREGKYSGGTTYSLYIECDESGTPLYDSKGE